MDAFDPVSEPRYNVSLLGLRSLQKQRYMLAITMRRSSARAMTGMLKDKHCTRCDLSLRQGNQTESR